MIKNIENYNELEMRKLVASKIGASVFDVPYIQSVTEITRLNIDSKEVDKVNLIRYWKGGKVAEIEVPVMYDSYLETEDDTDEDDKWFENYYECVRCGERWITEGDSMHEDDCPECNKTMQPYDSTEIFNEIDEEK